MSQRKVEMVLELIDRATRPAQRFMALQRRMGSAVQRANRIAARSARAAGRATDIYKRAVQSLDRAQDALQRGIRRSNALIRRQVGQMRAATGLMRNGMMGFGRGTDAGSCTPVREIPDNFDHYGRIRTGRKRCDGLGAGFCGQHTL